MSDPIRKLVILGGGSAGFLSAICLRRMLPEVPVTLVHSSEIGVIGVGESTTAFLPRFLHHHLGLDRKQFYDEVRPSWKLGIRFLWGHPDRERFYYPFDNTMGVEIPDLPRISAGYCLHDTTDASHYLAIMDRELSPCLRTADGRYIVNDDVGYHLDNAALLRYLERKAVELAVEVIDAKVVQVTRHADGDVAGLRLEDERTVEGDLFVDCSGFRSRLLSETMEVPYVSYQDALFCDAAVVGSRAAGPTVLPYTTSETMDHGWCWQIEFEDRVTRGYVYSSRFCTADEAAEELRAKNPDLGDQLRTLRFPSGRYENYWVGNVIAVGNASGFVEPLEATALHLIAEQISAVCKILRDCDLRVEPQIREIENRRYRGLWDEVRDFLALHYKFNEHSDSEFWKHCREETPLGQLEPLVDFYRRFGPARQCYALMPEGSIFGFHGYLTMLIGLAIPVERPPEFTERELDGWSRYRQGIRQAISGTVPVREGLQVVHHPAWRWPTTGV